MRQALQALLDQLAALQQQIGELERSIHAQHRASEASRRLETIPGIGVIGATAIAATVTDPAVFKSGREFAAWIGLVPRQNSTGGKERLGGDLEAGRSLSAPAAGRRGDGGHPARADASRQASLADEAAGAGSRPRWSRSRSPTRWRASPGRFWPRARPIERRRLRRGLKRLGDECVRSRRARRIRIARVMMA